MCEYYSIVNSRQPIRSFMYIYIYRIREESYLGEREREIIFLFILHIIVIIRLCLHAARLTARLADFNTDALI